jgi:hypothetical protein
MPKNKQQVIQKALDTYAGNSTPAQKGAATRSLRKAGVLQSEAASYYSSLSQAEEDKFRTALKIVLEKLQAVVA